MTLVQIRQAIVTELTSFWVRENIKLIFQNVESLDLALHKDGFIRFMVEFGGANQANIAIKPFSRIYGDAVFQIFLPVNKGTVGALTYIDELSAHFGYKTIGGLHLQTPQPGDDMTRDGWFSIELRIPFYADSNT